MIKTKIYSHSSFAKLQPEYGYTVTFTDNGTYSSTMTSGFFMSPGNVYKSDLRKYRVSGAFFVPKNVYYSLKIAYHFIKVNQIFMTSQL